MLICHYASPLGDLTLAGEGDALAGLWFDGQVHYGSTLPEATGEGWLPVFDDAFRWLDSYFGGYVPAAMPELDLRGSAFQKRVWKELLTIPYGETVSYGELARRLGSSARAVGGAVGRNPVSLIVPCHRVIGADGRLTGYGGGLERKILLLELERVPGWAR